MEPQKLLTICFLAILGLALYPTQTEACSCALGHPQSAYCKADYVIIARVLRRTYRRATHEYLYKIDIKKEYKMTENARQYLKHGRITTADSDSMCGIDLKLGGLYLFAGSSSRFSLCNYYKEYSKLTLVERRGMAGGYKKGCSCKIEQCFSNRCQPIEGGCNWNPFLHCETNYGACVPSRGLLDQDGKPTKCHWRRSPPYNQCLTNP